ncbi:MAG: MGMT family protein [Bacilli bacterium]|nr:MGMT family protein [Bacilli bacterium]
MKEKVYEYLRIIPKGKVATYGSIALYLGNKNLSRVVGNILHSNEDGDNFPCYKVVNAKGYLSKNYKFGGIDEQKRRLEGDGIEVTNYRVDLRKYKM